MGQKDLQSVLGYGSWCDVRFGEKKGAKKKNLFEPRRHKKTLCCQGYDAPPHTTTPTLPRKKEASQIFIQNKSTQIDSPLQK